MSHILSEEKKNKDHSLDFRIGERTLQVMQTRVATRRLPSLSRTYVAFAAVAFFTFAYFFTV